MPRPSCSSSTSMRQKTPVYINVYDLLPPGRLSNILWMFGTGLLHTGVVIGDKEYAFGGHDLEGVTGVYSTKPRSTPPGGTFRTEVLHGFTFMEEDERDEVIAEASKLFTGPSYNLLSRNCNHFTSHLCEALTGQPAPKWINRAAGIGGAIPCVVPAGWVEPPECDLSDGDDEERARLTSNGFQMQLQGVWTGSSDDEDDDEERDSERWSKEEQKYALMGRAKGDVRDQEGRELPSSERAKLDRVGR